MNMHELVGAYALDALSPQEREEFELHLETCEQCRAELASLADVLDGLASDGEEAPVPVGLRERIAAELAVTSQDASTSPVPAGAPAAPSDNVVPLRRRRVGRVIGLAAASLVVIALAATALSIFNKPSDADRIRAASDVVELQLGIPDVTVYASQSAGGVAVEGDMPAPAEGKEYQLWVVPADGSAPVPGPTMGGGETDAAWLTDLDGAAAIAVSLEPEGGSTAPTDVLASAKL